MGFMLRKSIKLGKHTKLNISKSGLGISTGVKGARVGINAKGKAYVSGGKDGIYYRKQLSSNKENKIPLKNQVQDIKKYNFKIVGKAVNKLIKKCFISCIIGFVLMVLFLPLGYIWLIGTGIIGIGTFISLEKKLFSCNKENKFVDEGL